MSDARKLDEALDAVRDEGAGRHSTLWVYMHDHHDTVVRRIEGGASYKELAIAFGRLGLRDKKGNVADHSTVRQTWWRVNKFVAERRAKSPPPKPPRREWPLGPGEIAPGVRPVAQPSEPSTGVTGPVTPAAESPLKAMFAEHDRRARPWIPTTERK